MIAPSLRRASLRLLFMLVLSATATAAERGELGPDVPPFTVRPGYRVTLVSPPKLREARFLEFDDKGTLYVSQPYLGCIVALRDKDGDGAYETSATFVSDKDTAHGMCFHDGWLWFTQSGAVHRARDKDGDGVADDVVNVIPDGKLPSGSSHWWRSLLVTDDAIYTSIGDSRNVSDETTTERQKVWRFDLTGRNRKLFSAGIRNTEKLRLRPATAELWGCDHGSDDFGKKYGEFERNQPITDLNPPDEFNRYIEGNFYGHPFITGTKLPRPEYAAREDILALAAKTTPPQWAFGAHWATNGWTFLTKDYFPGHQGDAFVACHGSWNSSNKVGYRIERVMFDPWTGKPCGAQMIVSTLSANGNTVLARPVDCVEAPDGSVLFSCDFTRRIYRISKSK